jgi:hypothetical protein
MFALTVNDQSFMSTFPKFAVIVTISMAVYVLICRLMKLEEATMVINWLKRWALKTYKNRGVVPQ